MADKRMFSKTIIDSDMFLNLPLSAQALYFHLSMRADDDGFVNNPRKIQRIVGCNDGDFQVLLEKQFLIAFESGVLVIKHWRIHNTIKNDRYKPTLYQNEFHRLICAENGEYDAKPPIETLSGSNLDPTWIQSGSKVEPQYRLDKISIEKSSLYCAESNDTVVSAPKPKKTPSEFTLSLHDNSEYNVPLEDVEKYKRFFPNVDVEQQLRNMMAWCMSNPTQRKTRRGIKRFITGWLAREQDKHRNRSFSQDGPEPKWF